MDGPLRQRRNHYVPEFYLDQWTVDGKLWRYTRDPFKQRVNAKRKSPREVGFEHDLYSLEPEHFTDLGPDELEVRLADEEGSAARVFAKMLAAGVASLSREERRGWSRFMYLQLERDPDRLRYATTLAERLRRETLERFPLLPDDVSRLITPAAARNMARGLLVAPDPARSEWEQCLESWMWNSASAPGRFITSDRPVMLDFGTGGPGVEASCVALALSPDRLLLCTPRSWEEELDHDWLRDIGAMFNAFIVASGPRFIFSARPLEEASGVTLQFVEQCLAPANR